MKVETTVSEEGPARSAPVLEYWSILLILVVTPNFTESVAESVDYGKYMRFDFPHIKGAYETANHH